MERLLSVEKSPLSSRRMLGMAAILAMTTSSTSPLVSDVMSASRLIGIENTYLVKNNWTAEMTLSEYDNANIAFIPYGLSRQEAVEIVTEFEMNFGKIVDQLINVETTVVMPNSQADRSYDQHLEKDCYNAIDTTKHSAAYLSDKVMPELIKYDKVIALSNLPLCDEASVLGRADMLSARYADIYNVDDYWQVTKEKRAADAQESQLRGYSAIIPQRTPADTIAHELLHLYGVGHGHSIDRGIYNAQAYATLREWAEKNPGAILPLQSYISGARFAEYGAEDIMGSGISWYEKKISLAQQYVLDWPNRLLDRDTAVEVSSMSDLPHRFEKSDKPTVILHELTQPIVLQAVDDKQLKGNFDVAAFTEVLFAPEYHDDVSLAHSEGLSVYLLGERGNTLQLGTVEFSYGTILTYAFDLGDVTVKATLDSVNRSIALATH